MSAAPRVMVLNGLGINCNDETARMFEMAGAEPAQVHVNEWLGGEASLLDHDILALPGGFSNGDDIAAGRILGIELRTDARVVDELNEFRAAGKLGIFICNGFQVAVETGLLPSGEVRAERDRSVALAANRRGVFDDRWGHLLVGDSVSKFVSRGVLGNLIEMPWANLEGRFLRSSEAGYQELFDGGQVVFRYATKDGEAAEAEPDNPTSEPHAIAGVTDPSGQFLGLMPHPERFADTMQHPDVRRRDVGVPSGLLIAKSMVEYFA